MGIKVNWPQDDKAASYPGEITPGEHLCIIDKCEETVTQKGDQMFKMTLKVVDGDCKGETGFDRISVGEGFALRRFMAVVYRLGIRPPPGTELEAEDIHGRVAFVTWEQVEQDGKTYNNVTRNGYRVATKEDLEGVNTDEDPDDDIPF